MRHRIAGYFVIDLSANRLLSVGNPHDHRNRLTVASRENNGETLHAILQTPDGNSLLDVKQDSNGPFTRLRLVDED